MRYRSMEPKFTDEADPKSMTPELDVAAAGSGSVKRKWAPPFGRFAPEMRPPCAAMIDWQMARPMPIPASLVLKKLSKTCARSAAGTPGPLSKTEKTTEPSVIDRRPGIDPARWLARLHDRLDAVDQQVDDHLLQLNPVAHDLGRPAPNVADRTIDFESMSWRMNRRASSTTSFRSMRRFSGSCFAAMPRMR